ncbi:MAG: hypothetical protein GHCLOJNM_02018 [bacterium]|nr:hypothetical protein [bacterium]
MEPLQLLLGGVGGGIITGSVNYYIYRKTRAQPTGKAYHLLKGLKKVLGAPQGEHFHAKDANDNYAIANHIYANADGRIIATAFHDDPATYGDADLVRGFQYGGSLVTRVTCAEVCGPRSTEDAQTRLVEWLPGASLVVIPAGERFVRLDGIFCKFNDDTHLCFFAFRDPKQAKKNRGLVFRDGIAVQFFDYFEGLALLYK